MGQVERKTKGWANFKGKSEMIFQELKIFDWPIYVRVQGNKRLLTKP